MGVNLQVGLHIAWRCIQPPGVRRFEIRYLSILSVLQVLHNVFRR